MFTQIGYLICVPFAVLTRFFYKFTGSYGIALILFTLVVKLVLIPFQIKSKKSMLRMGRMQGKVKDIQTRYANDRVKQQEELSNLYAQEGINPMSGCIWSFIPLPILIALYYIIRTPLRYFMLLKVEVIEDITKFATTLGYTAAESKSAAAYEQIYLAKFIHENWSSFEGKYDGLLNLDYNFLGIDLAETASNVVKNIKGGGWPVWGLLMLPVLAGVLQLVMSMLSMKGQPDTGASNKAMMYMFPLMTIWMGYILPAALCIYWVANAGFTAIQEAFMNKFFSKKLDAEETEKEKKKREERIAKFEKQKALQAQINAERSKSKQQKPAQKKSDSSKRDSTTENGRVGSRPYARGRAYSEDHYSDK